MPIVIKGVELTEKVREDLRKIIGNVDNIRSPYLANRVRKTEEGIVIPSGYPRLFDAIKEKYPDVILTPLDQGKERQRCIDRNRHFFNKFKEYNGEYLKTGNNVIITVTSAPGEELMDPEKVIAFITKVFSKVTPAQGHKFKVTARYQVLDSIREKINADGFKDGSGASVKDRCATMAIRRIEGRPLQRGTKIAVVVSAAKVESLFATLTADELFERIPAIRFINPETRRQHIKERREKAQSADDSSSVAKNKQQKHRDAKSESKKDRTKKSSKATNPTNQTKEDKPQKQQSKKVLPRFPCLLTISGIPENLSFDDVKANLDDTVHAYILKAIAESKQRKPRNPVPSEVAFFCTMENGKVLDEAFSNMEINGVLLRSKLSDAK